MHTKKMTPDDNPKDSGIFFSPSLLPFLLMSRPKRPALRVKRATSGMVDLVRK